MNCAVISISRVARICFYFFKYNCDFYFSEPEPAIIDYVTQQYKLFPNIATCFAFQYAATWLWDTYNNVTGELEIGNLGNLPEVSISNMFLQYPI